MMSEAWQRTVLVVEDDPDVQEVVGECLKIHGYNVAQASNGAEALQYLSHLRGDPAPSLILLDLMMPTMNGREFLARRVGYPDLAQIPVVVLTAASDPRYELRDLPPTSVLRKPFDLEVLLARVNYLSNGPLSVQA
jgi:CheY-like chemotaxis protein